MKTTDKDPWKEFIDNNKSAFDQRKPKDLWSSIEENLDPVEKKSPKLVPLWKVYRVAAVLIVAVTAGYFLISHEKEKAPIVAIEEIDQTTEEPQYANEFVEAENYYAVEIDKKMEELTELVDDESLMVEVKLLRKEFDQLKLEMGDQVNDQRVLEALIQNYRLRLNLLKEMLEQIKSDGTKTKNRNNERNAI